MMKFLSSAPSGKRLDWALLIIRIAAGVVFMFHGYGKLFGHAPGMGPFTGMVAGMGFPLPGLFAYLAALSEFFGGLALLLGLWTEIAGVFTTIVMLVALIGVKKVKLPMADPDVTLLAMSIALVLAGPGSYSLQAMWNKKKAPSDGKSA